MAILYERKGTYRRDHEDRRGQGLLPWGPGKTISTLEAAAIMKVSDDMIRTMCEEGELEGYRLRPKAKRSPWRIVRESLYRHIGKVIDEYGPGDPELTRSALPPQRSHPPQSPKK